MRHYAVWIDADSIVPENSNLVSEQVKALKKDPAAILVTDNRAAYHAGFLGIPVIMFHYLPAGATVMVSPILPYLETDFIRLASPFPWSAKAAQAIPAARSSIDESARKDLIPLPKHGLI